MKAVRLKALALVLVMGGIHAGLLFGIAGRFDIPWFWAVLGLWLAGAHRVRFRLVPGVW